MVKVKEKSIDHYVEKMQAHLLRKYPDLRFEVVRRGDREATIYYAPFREEDDYPIIKRVGNIATDALLEGGYRIYIMPSA
jgi:hypothetical protein